MNRIGKLLVTGVALVLALALLSPAAAQAPAEKPKLSSAAQTFALMFEQSLKDKKGLTLYMGGQVIGGAVTRIGPDVVELRNQEFSQIVVRIDRIDGVAAH